MARQAAVLRDPRSNNLDSLRLILAALVVLEHSNNLFHVALDDPTRFSFFLVNLSDVAVSAFFVISGMLTWISYERDPDLIRFYLRRFFRVFPAYWSVLALQIGVFCLVAAALVDWGKMPTYVLFNAMTANFLEPTFLEGVPALNGSLWTIKIEAGYYLILPFMFALMLRLPWLLVLSVLSFVWAVGIDSATLAKQLPGKIYLFALGVGLARLAPRITDGHSMGAMLLIPAGVFLKFATEDTAVLGELSEAALGVCLVVAFLRPWLKRETLDISYTLYLMHYPVLVFVTRFLLPGEPFWLVLTVGAALSVALSVAMSLLIERPALRFGRGLVARAGRPRSAAPGPQGT